MCGGLEFHNNPVTIEGIPSSNENKNYTLNHLIFVKCESGRACECESGRV